MICGECGFIVYNGDYALHYCDKAKEIVTVNTECLLKQKEREQMDNEKVLELVDRIEAALRELAEVTGEKCINSFLYDGSFSLDSSTNERGQRVLNFFRTEANNE